MLLGEGQAAPWVKVTRAPGIPAGAAGARAALAAVHKPAAGRGRSGYWGGVEAGDGEDVVQGQDVLRQADACASLQGGTAVAVAALQGRAAAAVTASLGHGSPNLGAAGLPGGAAPSQLVRLRQGAAVALGGRCQGLARVLVQV